MPVRAPRICSCGKTVASGERCRCVELRDRERKARHDKVRPTARQRGYDREWEKARAEFLALHPNCQRPGCGAKAALVDHITPIRKAPHRRLDRTNFMALCTPCHSRWKQAQEKGTKQ